MIRAHVCVCARARARVCVCVCVCDCVCVCVCRSGYYLCCDCMSKYNFSLVARVVGVGYGAFGLHTRIPVWWAKYHNFLFITVFLLH